MTTMAVHVMCKNFSKDFEHDLYPYAQSCSSYTV